MNYRRSTSYLSALSALTISASLFPAVAASAAGAGGPHIVPESTVVHATLAPGASVVVHAALFGLPLVASCATLSASATTPAFGLSAPVAGDPVFGGCAVTEVGGRSDMIPLTLVASGTWTASIRHDGKGIHLRIPKDGATITTSLVTCKVVFGGVTLYGSYSDGLWQVDDKDIPMTSINGCAFSPTVSLSATIAISPSIAVAP